ncbi:hypothetical protein C8Q74DRAFT_718734 [Fomes fomentarius]|nr:hypothetical protein C8Q74DRAFT_718734 [Fomes fomentarius]
MRPPAKFHLGVPSNPMLAIRASLGHRFGLSRARPVNGNASLHSSQFSTYRPLCLDNKSSSYKPNDARPSSGNSDYPSFTFEELGISKNMKVVILTIIGILGTVETWTWARVIWHWWEGGNGETDETKDASE